MGHIYDPFIYRGFSLKILSTVYCEVQSFPYVLNVSVTSSIENNSPKINVFPSYSLFTYTVHLYKYRDFRDFHQNKYDSKIVEYSMTCEKDNTCIYNLKKLIVCRSWN